MLNAAVKFVLDVREGNPCPWLVLLGTSGAGKSHLARRVWLWWSLCGRFYVDRGTGASMVRSGQFCRFADFVQEGRSGDFSRAVDLVEDRLVVLDDIAAGADARGWIADKLYHILEHRVGDGPQATLVTANLSIEALGEMYDQRIASRLVRRGTDNVVEVNVPDYMTR
jgi:DNA replication protein DnaC